MDIKFTFEDGGEFLAHYGKVGMRWRKGRKTPAKTMPRTTSAISNRINKLLKSNQQTYGLSKGQRSYTGKAGLTDSYAKDVSSASSSHASIKRQQTMQKLLGYSNRRKRG